MKKLLFLFVTTGCIVTGCNNKVDDKTTTGSGDSAVKAQDKDEDKSTSTTKPIEWAKYTSISEEEAVKMADNYIKIISKDPAKCIQLLNMDGSVLEGILYETEGIKLVSAANLKTNDVTAIIQLWRGGKPLYYDINQFFNAEQPGSKGGKPICPPPDSCRWWMLMQMPTYGIPEARVDEMAKLYLSLVKSNPEMAIQQINMSGALLYTLLYKTQGFALIAAADLQYKEPTVVIQFRRGEQNSYFNIKEMFTATMPGMRGKPPVCPPPDGCELPFSPFPKNK